MATKTTGSSRREEPTKVQRIEAEISKYAALIQEAGKTDEIEDALDRIEHEIGQLKAAGISDPIVKQLKDHLDQIK